RGGAQLARLGAAVVLVPDAGPIAAQVRRAVSPEGVKYAIDPVIGETGTQMFKALHEDGKMLLYGSLTRQPMLVGDDPRYILAGRRRLEVYWLGYWLARLDREMRERLVRDIVDLMREGILETSPGTKFPLTQIEAAVAQSEIKNRKGKVLLVPGSE
ncbi:zinc-binding dehydrogenase, partial [Streptomyces sp. NPDC054933]